MKSEKEILEDISDIFPKYIIAFVVVISLEVFVMYLFKSGAVSHNLYAVFLAPPAEEALKGTAVFLVAPAIYLLYLHVTSKNKSNPFVWAVLAGVIIGSSFGLTESIFQGESIIALELGLITHSVWTIALGIGSLLYWIHGEKKLLPLIYIVTVSGHIAWNYDFHNLVTSILLVSAIPIAFIGYKYLSVEDFS